MTQDVAGFMQDRFSEALKPFQHQVNSEQTRAQIKSVMMSVVQDALARGELIAPVPLFDVNDCQEEEWLQKRIVELEAQRKSSAPRTHLDASDPADVELWKLSLRLSTIAERDERRDPTSLDIVMKDSETFEELAFDPVTSQIGKL